MRFYKPLTKTFWKLSILLTAVGIVFLLYNLWYFNKIFPNVFVASIPVEGLNKEETKKALSNLNAKNQITLLFEKGVYDLKLDDINLYYDLDKSVLAAFEISRDGNFFEDNYQRLSLFFEKVNLPLSITVDETKLTEHLMIIADSINKDPVFPKAREIQGRITIEAGQAGRLVELPRLKKIITDNLMQANFEPIPIPVEIIDPTITPQEEQAFRKEAQKLAGKSLVLKIKNQEFSFDKDELLAFVSYDGFSQEEISKAAGRIATLVNKEPQNARFIFREGKVKEFSPGKDGFVVNRMLLQNGFFEKLTFLATSTEQSGELEIPVDRISPDLTTEKVNNLGIKELIGQGKSKFWGSIPGRAHNISLAASKFNGVLIPPGEILSFNDVLGDVSNFTGYKEAYIIKDGRTVLGDGGGVCQVSTTLFRAAINAGLPIIERRAHSYRVGYYEQGFPPGLDATVFAPTTDLKIKNDSPGHLLIQTEFNPVKAELTFEIYGTRDGRIATTTKPVVSAVSSPPEDLYLDDPTLSAGVVKQIEHKAWGAKVSFDYKVSRNAEVIFEKTFFSNYLPWQAVFLRGTGAAQ